MMPSVGPMEIAVLLVIALIVLGPKKLPDFARSAGRGMREFKTALRTDTRDEEPPAAEPSAPGA